MKVAILGFDIEGQASLAYFSKLGHDITICDQNEQLVIPDGVASQLGPSYLHDLDRFDMLVRTPGLHPHTILATNPGVAAKITSGTNEFFKVCPTKNIIGITGTKGKGTTSTLVAKMLEAAGKTVHLGGNIGVAALTMLPNIQPDDWVVLELSNFQLIDLKYSPHIAACLMVVPEHLNWHANMEEYFNSKQQLFEQQTPDDIAIYFSENSNSTTIARAGQGHKVPYYQAPGAQVAGNKIVIASQEICEVSEIKLLGNHNVQNACAATTVLWQICQDVVAIHSVLTSFAGLPHRLEKVGDVNGVTYYNDSFAATPDAAIAAINAIPAPKVMILGGFDRQLPIEHLAKALHDHENDIVKLILIGQSAQRLADALQAAGTANYTIVTAKTMSEIVSLAKSYARPGVAVILSPGFASFDMFKNFEDRGNQYKVAVQAL